MLMSFLMDYFLPLPPSLRSSEKKNSPLIADLMSESGMKSKRIEIQTIVRMIPEGVYFGIGHVKSIATT